MIGYLCADLKRIAVRIPRWIVLLVLYGILVAILVFSHNEETTSVVFITMVEQYIRVLTVFLGLVELISIYSDDFKARTMQVAIGIGVSRRAVILCKFLELLLYAFIDLAAFGLIALVVSLIQRIGLHSAQIVEMFTMLFNVWVSIAGYISLSMIVLFFMQATGIGTLLYLALSTGTVSSLLSLLTGLDAVKRFHLDQYTLTSLLKASGTQLLLGNIHWAAFLGVALYIALGYNRTSALFRRRELEF